MSARLPIIRRAAMLWIAAASIQFASAGEVYKCTIGDSTVYQDTPCRDGRQDSMQLPKDSIAENAASFRLLARQIDEAAVENRRANTALSNREIAEYDLARARLRLARGAPLPSQEKARIEYVLAPLREHSLAAEANYKALMELLRARCPGGSVLKPSRLECRPR
jgi:hypothetical protein